MTTPDLAELRRRHRQSTSTSASTHFCVLDMARWPCLTIQLLDRIERQEREIERLTAINGAIDSTREQNAELIGNLKAELVAAREANTQLESRLQTAYDMMDTLGWERTRAALAAGKGEE